MLDAWQHNKNIRGISMNIPAFVINLDDSKERLAHVTYELRNAGIDFTRIPAFDGRKMPTEQIEDYNPKAAMKALGRELSGGEIGCYKSHITALQKFLETDAEYGMVFEDDIEVNPLLLKDVKTLIEFFEERSVKWDVVHLGANAAKLCRPVDRTGLFASGSQVLHAHYFPMVASGLLWSRKGASSFLNHRKDIRIPIDTEFRDVMVRGNQGYCFWPRLVKQRDVVSDMDGTSAPRRRVQRHWSYGPKKQVSLFSNKFHAIKNIIKRT